MKYFNLLFLLVWLMITTKLLYSQQEVQHKISSDTVWNVEMEVIHEVVIQNHASLTVTDRIRIAENAKIIIQPGGKLILDGG
ncbi:MAG TPA: hypothetical protein PK915_12940, partial [Bacteroidales bacterium]|nr:hypothetical protein [Bacteroidales bacterium]